MGCIKMKVFLSGMPELRLGVNDKLRFESNGSELTHIVNISSFLSIAILASTFNPALKKLGEAVNCWVACGTFCGWDFLS